MGSARPRCRCNPLRANIAETLQLVSRARREFSMKSNQAYASIPTVLPAAERSEAERSEAERSGAAGKTAADPGAVPRPDPQVVAKAKRRIFTAEYKQRILAEADKAKERPGALGTLLRRESLY